MTNYKGLKWLKCDLHMHNPLDNNWKGEKKDNIDDMAYDYALACHSSGLDVIGMTSHSYNGLKFYPYLEKALKRVKTETGHQITCFPGFELSIHIGLDVHVICLFEPGTENIDHILTSLGAPPNDYIGTSETVKLQKNLSEILREVQDKHHGIVTLPHVFSRHGLLDGSTYPNDFAAEDFCNPGLLAVEVSKPVSEMSLNFQKMFRASHDCAPVWKRDLPIASLKCSDCKQLIALDEHTQMPLANSIGYRYSWVKMSKPSIEALKQAFFDHASRISLENDSPDTSIFHPHIVSLKIENSKFLEDQEVFFSPNLNCVIGGRGSGKSSLIEYLRLVFKKDDGKEIAGDHKTKERIDRIRNTLLSSGKLTAVWQRTEGVSETIIWDNGATFPSEPQENTDTFFKGISASFFSQQQLTHMTAAEKYDDNKQQAQKLQDLIDGFFPDKMRELDRREQSLKTQVSEAFDAQRSIRAKEAEISEIKQELQTAMKEYSARQELQEPQKIFQSLVLEKQHLDELRSSPFAGFSQFLDEVGKRANDAVQIFTQNPSRLSEAGFEFPHAADFTRAQIDINTILADTTNNIRALVANFNNQIHDYLSKDPWPTITAQLELAEQEFETKLAEKGLKREDISHLQTLLDRIKTLTEALKEKISTLDEKKKAAPVIDHLMSSLYEVWLKQFHLRQEAVLMANQHTSGGETSYKVIEVVATYQDDNKDFLEQWRELSPKGSTKLGIGWIEIGNRIFDEFRQARINPSLSTDKSSEGQLSIHSPWQLIQSAISNNQIMSITAWINRPEPDLPELFIAHIASLGDKWEEMYRSRIKDSIDLTLYRADSTQAGMISNSTLSDGQRNTAALVLLLSQEETGPLVIDQPEEELDSEFIYNELLPLLREKKNRRQLIFATHNANLPVNGDSELVYAFEARSNKGKCLAEGGLDQKPVADAVLKVMEGSAEAFRRRRNKYHF